MKPAAIPIFITLYGSLNLRQELSTQHSDKSSCRGIPGGRGYCGNCRRSCSRIIFEVYFPFSGSFEGSGESKNKYLEYIESIIGRRIGNARELDVKGSDLTVSLTGKPQVLRGPISEE